MKSIIIPMTVLSLMASSALQAKTSMQAVVNLAASTKEESWKGLSAYQIPASVLGLVTIEDPSAAFSAPLEDIFFHDMNMLLCYNNCAGEQNIVIQTSNEGYTIPLRGPKWFNKRSVLKSNATIIRQNTVYYWINQMFDRLAEVGFTPATQLKIFVDRVVPEIDSRGNSENNAFYNPEDNTLSFLPAHNGLLSKMSDGALRPSGYDPTVAVHEAGHFVFQELTQGRNINTEIGGLNEGFADYLAMVVLNTSKIGTVMMAGKTLRDATQIKYYSRNMEVHDLGNVFSSALWNIRSVAQDKKSVDRAVMDSVRELGRNPYATAFDFGPLMLKHLRTQSGDEALIAEAGKIFTRSGLTGSYPTMDTSILRQARPKKNFMGAAITLSVPKELARQYGLKEVDHVRLSLLEKVELKQMNERGQTHTLVQAAITDDRLATPIWLHLEAGSSNVLNAYDLSGQPISDSEMIKYVTKIASNLSSLEEFKNMTSVKSMMSMIVGNDWMAKVSVKKRQEKHLNINGKLVPVMQTTGNVNLKFLGRLASLFVKPIKEFNKVTYYTSKDPAFKGKLPAMGDEGFLIGYEYSLKNGLSQSLVVDSLDL